MRIATRRRRVTRPGGRHGLNNGADILATKGIGAHIADPGRVAKAAWQVHRARSHWKYLLTVYKIVRTLKHERSEEGLADHCRAGGPKNRPRTERTADHWKRQHKIERWSTTEGCTKCGRTLCKGKRQARLTQWRQPCVMLKVHQRRAMSMRSVRRGYTSAYKDGLQVGDQTPRGLPALSRQQIRARRARCTEASVSRGMPSQCTGT